MSREQPRGAGDRRKVPSPPGHKWCPKCEQHKPLSNFYPRKRNEDGSIKSYAGYCKKCSNAGSNEAAFDAVRDPVRGPRRRELHRINERVARERRGIPSRGVPYKLKGLKEGYRRSRDLVDSQPFIQWLDRHLRVNDLTIADFAVRVGTDEAQVRRMQSQPQVSLSVVDRMLIDSDTDVQLWELYPDQD